MQPEKIYWGPVRKRHSGEGRVSPEYLYIYRI